MRVNLQRDPAVVII